MKKQKTILITGASSGIGKALAMLYANQGVTLLLTGRNEERLREVENLCFQKGALVETSVLCVTKFNTVNPLIPRMISRKSGHIVLMSSMAGFRGMPNAPAYSVSKVAVRAYGDALRPLLKQKGITVSTIFPGFVKTPLTDVNGFHMPFLMEVDRAAEIIRRGLDAKKASIAFPRRMHALCWLLGVMPRFIGDEILSRAPKKEQE